MAWFRRRADAGVIMHRDRGSYYVIIAAAGHDTVSSSISVAMWALNRFPELLPRLQADRSLIPQFIDETLRYASPVRHFMRTATADTNVRGRTIRKGDWLMLRYGSANRDEQVSPELFAFNFDRKPNRHLAFSVGAHVCLGQHLRYRQADAAHRYRRARTPSGDRPVALSRVRRDPRWRDTQAARRQHREGLND